ncbi:MAG: hypothetical protein JST30_05930 [Armatimonadetes bacterium]|nr:hypothetical protein [Armatimonadota bacterium]
MKLYLVDGGTDDVQATENFLMRLCGVLDASVWSRDGRIVASVTLSNDATYGADELHSACQAGLGRAPHLFMLQRAFRPAAAA